ncbi:hypothetical protein MXB_4550, partial [Myxobolus squamalis]
MYNITRDYNENLKTKHVGDEFPKFDEISHFLLRLAFCKQYFSYKYWFVSLEADLLRFCTSFQFDRFKLKKFPATNMESLLKHSNLNYQKMENKNKNNGDKPESYYKIRFEDVLDLVRSRKVYLESVVPLFLPKGFAHVPVDLLIPLIVEFFKNHLYKECEKLVSNIHRIEEDDRLLLRLSNIISYHESNTFDYKNTNYEKVNINNIDGICDESFPPCMYCAHQNLKREGHLKHQGRIQYGLFLKGIGLTLEESLVFWRKYFGKKIESQK